eukprot:scaffold73458_cov67-Cyclotella_meneghiniana.AAC.3
MQIQIFALLRLIVVSARGSPTYAPAGGGELGRVTGPKADGRTSQTLCCCSDNSWVAATAAITKAVHILLYVAAYQQGGGGGGARKRRDGP